MGVFIGSKNAHSERQRENRGAKMEDLQIIEVLKEFFTGNTLVAAYIAYYVVKMALKPLYVNGTVIKDLAVALTKALNEGVFSHSEIVVELKALNALLGDARKQEE